MPCQGVVRRIVKSAVTALAIPRGRVGRSVLMREETPFLGARRFQDDRIEPVWQALRIGFGVAIFLAGLDKFFNLLTDWPQYLHPAVSRLIAPETFMRVAGV